MNEPQPPDEKRGDPRVTAEYRVHLVASLHGFEGENRRYDAPGITINVSHRGALVRIGQPVSAGSRCLLHLPEGERKLGKSLIYGTVVRARAVEDTYEVAIEFDTRLQAISIEDSLDGI